MILPFDRPLPPTHECAACGRGETIHDAVLPDAWQLRWDGAGHVLICGYCIPAWEGRARPKIHELAETMPLEGPVPMLVDDTGKAWIAIDRAFGNDLSRAFAFMSTGGPEIARSLQVHAGLQVTHWPMPELGGAAILFIGADRGEGDPDAVLVTMSAGDLEELMAKLATIRERM